MRNLGGFLNQIESRIEERSPLVTVRVIVATVTFTPGSMAALDSLCLYFVEVGVIDYSNGVAGRAILVAVDMAWQGGVVFRAVGNVSHLRLTGEIDSEEICPAGIVDPFLREARHRKNKQA